MEWISVKDRLPDERDTYIVYTDDTSENVSEPIWSKEVVLTAEFDEYGWSWREGVNDYDITNFVTHWMPLPEPPKED